MRKAPLAAMCALLASPLAADGMLDPGFGVGGKVITNLPTFGSERVRALALMPDGRAVAVGTSTTGQGQAWMGAARFTPQGGLDPTFDGDGLVVITFPPISFAAALATVLQSDGRLVMAGTTSVGGGNSRMALARLDVNGALDATFGTGGRVAIDCPGMTSCAALSVALQADGRIVAGGRGSTPASPFPLETGVVARFQADGTPDASFGNGGFAILPTAWNLEVASMALMGDGRIVLGGASPFALGLGDLAAVRLLADGSPDPTFDGDGIARAVFPMDQDAHAMVVQSNGAVIVGGTHFANPGAHYAMVRFLPDGTLDTGFGSSGLATSQPGGGSEALMELPNGNLVQAGYGGPGPFLPDISLVRYLPNGQVDVSFGTAGFLSFDFEASMDSVSALALAGPDRILLGGGAIRQFTTTEDFALARFIATTPVALESFTVE